MINEFNEVEMTLIPHYLISNMEHIYRSLIDKLILLF